MLMLRSPEFGNSFKFVPNTIFHRNLNGDLRVYQGTRPTWQGFNVTFTAINREKIDQFKQFVEDSRGQVVTLVDFEQRTWTGIIVSPQIDIVAGKKQRAVIDGEPSEHECNFSTSFEFEGTVS